MTDELRALADEWARELIGRRGCDVLTVSRFAAVLVDRARIQSATGHPSGGSGAAPRPSCRRAAVMDPCRIPDRPPANPYRILPRAPWYHVVNPGGLVDRGGTAGGADVPDRCGRTMPASRCPAAAQIDEGGR